MAHGLEEWLSFTWGAIAPSKTPIPFTAIYGIYETNVDPNERGFALATNGLPTDFPDVEVPHNVLSSLENDAKPFGAISYSSRVQDEEDDPLLIGGTNTGAGYLYFPSPTHEDGASRHRIVVNASAYNKLIRMMRTVVREMNSPGGQFRRVNGAKVMTQACYQSGRNDTLIIYTRDKPTAELVLRTIGMWVAEGHFSTRDFSALLPRTVKRIYHGVGYACEPPQKQLISSYTAPLSYGKFLSQVIYIASTIALTAGLKNVQQFTVLANLVLNHAGVRAPDEPYEFGGMTATFADCLPWDDTSAWTDARRAAIKKTKLYKSVSERTEIAFSYFG